MAVMSGAVLRLACCVLLAVSALQGLSRAVERARGPLHYHAIPKILPAQASGSVAAVPTAIHGDHGTKAAPAQRRAPGHRHGHHGTHAVTDNGHGHPGGHRAGHGHEPPAAVDVLSRRGLLRLAADPHRHTALGRHRHDEARPDMVRVGTTGSQEGLPARAIGPEAFWLLAPEHPRLTARADRLPTCPRSAAGVMALPPGAPERPPRA